MAVVFAPEIDAAAEHGPGGGAGVPGVAFHEPGVGRPHHFLQFPEFAEEAGVAVIHFLRVFFQLGMVVTFDVPDAVWEGAALRARDFLLLEAPVGEFDFVAEEDAAGHYVDEFEFRLDRAEAGLRGAAIGHGFHYLDAEEVVGVAFEALVAVGGDFVLPVGFGDGGTHVVGVQAAVCRDVVEADEGAVEDVVGGDGVPGEGAGEGGVAGGVSAPVDGLGLVLDEPDVVLVFVRVEGDLLLVASRGVHVGVGVQVAALRVVVAEGNARAEGDFGGDVRHAFAVEGGLEFGAHEAVAVAGVDEAEEVDGEHGHVEGGGDDDETEDAGEEVLAPDAGGDVLAVAEQDPELQGGERTHPRDGEETNPLDAHRRAEREPRHAQPEPPARREGRRGTQLVLIREARPAQSRQCSEDDQRRVEQNQPRLRHQPILEKHQPRPDRGSERPASTRLERQEHGRHSENATESGQQAHRHIRHAGLEVVLPDILEIELAVKPRQPARQRDHHLRQRRVHVHEELALDVFAREAAEVHFVEDD